MARCVSRPLALGVGHILDGSLPPGLSRAAETGGAPRNGWPNWREGVEFTVRFARGRVRA